MYEHTGADNVHVGGSEQTLGPQTGADADGSGVRAVEQPRRQAPRTNAERGARREGAPYIRCMLRILSPDQADPGRDAVRFRQSSRPALLAAAASVLALLALRLAAAGNILPWPLAALAAGFVALFLLLTLTTLYRALAPDSWLLACDGERVLLRTRSYLNRRADDPDSVIEIPLSDLEAVREARLDVRGRDPLNDPHDREACFLELELRPEVDVSEVADRLRQERRRRTGSGAWLHYPLTIAGAHTLRVEWRSRHARTAPGLDRALTLLGERVRVETGTVEAVDLGAPGRTPSNQDTLRALRTLVVQGRVVEATQLAERSLGLDTTRAKALVDGIADRAD